MYFLWEFVCELLDIPVSCAYFEIFLVVCEMTDPLLGAPSQCHIHHSIFRRHVFPMQYLGRFIISSSIFFPLLLFIFSTSYLSFHIYYPYMFIDFEYDVSLYILVLLPISPHATLFTSHHYHRHFYWMS